MGRETIFHEPEGSRSEATQASSCFDSHEGCVAYLLCTHFTHDKDQGSPMFRHTTQVAAKLVVVAAEEACANIVDYKVALSRFKLHGAAPGRL